MNGSVGAVVGKRRRGRGSGALAALVMVATLVGCGSSDDAGVPGAGDPAGDGRCHEVEHLTGTACVPEDPQRIVVLDPFTALPTLVGLGAPVVGATSVYTGGDPFPGYLDPQAVEGIEVVGSALAPNLDAIYALHPDLIVAMSSAVADVEDQLAEIAPTVVTRFAFYTAEWRDDVRLVADLVGGGDAIEEQLTELDDRSAQLTTRLAGGPPPTLTTLTTTMEGVGYYRYGCTWIGDVLRRAGVDQPEAQAGDDCEQDDPQSTIIEVSPERFEILDAGGIVAFAQPSPGGGPETDPFATLGENPLWGGLEAVRTGSLFALGEAWGYGASIPAALVVLDDLDETVFPSP